jgi:erythromycin esterase-like protein
VDPLLDRVGGARLVLLGEALHGTAQYYSWRAEITCRVIVEKEFSFVAVEGDWPDCYRVNPVREVGPGGAARPSYGSGCLRAVADVDVGQRGDGGLRGWLREHNAGREAAQMVGFMACAAGRAAAFPVQMQRLVAFDSHADREGCGATMINGPSARRSVLPETATDAPSHGVS